MRLVPRRMLRVMVEKSLLLRLWRIRQIEYTLGLGWRKLWEDLLEGRLDLVRTCWLTCQLWNMPRILVELWLVMPNKCDDVRSFFVYRFKVALCMRLGITNGLTRRVHGVQWRWLSRRVDMVGLWHSRVSWKPMLLMRCRACPHTKQVSFERSCLIIYILRP